MLRLAASAIRRSISFTGTIDRYAACKDKKITDKLYDVAVIGGGSGGISCANQAAKLGLDVAIFDFVDPSPHGSHWGLGGTCVNVGCIPKKLFHHAAYLREQLMMAQDYGFKFDGAKVPFDWKSLTSNVQSHILRSNYELNLGLADNNVNYINCLASLSNANEIVYSPDKDQIEHFTQTQTIKDTEKAGKLKAKYIVVAVGGRPKVLTEDEMPGAQYVITSDDIFNMKTEPGKTLMLGAGYIAIECGTFLHLLGYPTTIIARSTMLRAFDSEVVNYLRQSMQKMDFDLREGTMLKTIKKTADGRLEAEIASSSTKEVLSREVFDTIAAAITRYPVTQLLNLKQVGVDSHTDSRKILGGSNGEPDLTTVDTIYAIGDVLEGAPELTPTAIKNGVAVANKIFKKLNGQKITAKDSVNFTCYPTTVFSYPEYSTVGLSEADAIKKFGKDKVNVYHLQSTPLEEELISRTFPKDDENELKIKSYFKVVSLAESEEILGLHYLGLHAGEVMQGFAVRASNFR